MNRLLKSLLVLVLFVFYAPLFSRAENKVEISLQTTLNLKDRIGAIEFSPDGKSIAVGISSGGLFVEEESDGEIVFINSRSLKTQSILKTPGSTPISVSFSSDQKFLAVGCLWNDVMTFDLETRKSKQLIKGSMAFVKYIPHSQRLIVSDAENQITIWNNGKKIVGKTVKHNPDGGPWEFALSPDGTMLAIAPTDRGREPVCEIEIFDSSTLKTKAKINAISKSVPALAFSADSSLLITGSEEGIIRIFDMRTMKEVRNFFAFNNKKQKCLPTFALSSTGDLLAVSAFSATSIWDLETNQLLATLPQSGPFVAMSPDGKMLLTTTNSDDFDFGYSRIQVWKINRTPNK